MLPHLDGGFHIVSQDTMNFGVNLKSPLAPTAFRVSHILLVIVRVHPSQPRHVSHGIYTPEHLPVPREVREYSCGCQGMLPEVPVVDLLAFPKVVLHALHCGGTAES